MDEREELEAILAQAKADGWRLTAHKILDLKKRYELAHKLIQAELKRVHDLEALINKVQCMTCANVAPDCECEVEDDE